MSAASPPPLLSSVGLRSMLYLVTPNETSFPDVEHTPNFVDGAVPYFTLLIVLECVVLRLQGKEAPRINDGVNSMSHGLLSVMHSLLLMRPVELVLYSWIHEHFCVLDLPWHSAVTWWAAFVGTDFLYYWFHRWSHESNIVWASHQVHHSSEDYNLTTALRQSLMQKYYSMLVYLPMATVVPPSAFYVHQQLNLLYQFWIHTQVVGTLGPLELILNTPSHHRVHHGRNPYCIDKNYAGTLIVWDRMFNTFQAEEEKVVFGLVHPNEFWNPIYGQACHYLHILRQVCGHSGLTNKLSAVVKGPGWEPGKPWRGLFSDLPQVPSPVQKHDSDLPVWASLYVLGHFTLTVASYSLVAQHKQDMPAVTALMCVTYFVLTVTVFGALFDQWHCSALMESVRCSVLVGALYLYRGPFTFDLSLTSAMYTVYFLSATLWLWVALTQLSRLRKKLD